VACEFDASETVFVFLNEGFRLFVGVDFVLLHGEDDEVLPTAFVAHQLGEGSPEDTEFLLVTGNDEGVSVEVGKARDFQTDSLLFLFDDSERFLGSDNGPVEVKTHSDSHVDQHKVRDDLKSMIVQGQKREAGDPVADDEEDCKYLIHKRDQVLLIVDFSLNVQHILYLSISV
jgi:hypothetical protein